jgi:hypothetical protein
MKFGMILRNAIVASGLLASTASFAGWHNILNAETKVRPGDNWTTIVPVQPTATNLLHVRVVNCPNVSVFGLEYVPYGASNFELTTATPRGRNRFELSYGYETPVVGSVRLSLNFHGIVHRWCTFSVSAWQPNAPVYQPPVIVSPQQPPVVVVSPQQPPVVVVSPQQPPVVVVSPQQPPVQPPVPAEDTVEIGRIVYRPSSSAVSATISFPLRYPTYTHKIRVNVDPRCAGLQVIGISAQTDDANVPATLNIRADEGYSYDVNDGEGAYLRAVRVELLGGSTTGSCPVTVIGTMVK